MEETPHPLAEGTKVDNYRRVIDDHRSDPEAIPGPAGSRETEDALVKMAEAEGTKKGMTTAQ